MRTCALLVVLVVTAATGSGPIDDATALYRQYWAGFGAATTELLYHHRLNGPRGLKALSSPEEIAAGTVGGKPMPYGYGSGVQDVSLENGQLLMAMLGAYERSHDERVAEAARRTFRGMKRIATASREPGFVPRGPHPDGCSYYRNSSRDQTAAMIEAMWAYAKSPLATPEDRAFARDEVAAILTRMEKYGWKLMVEDGASQAHVGFAWDQSTTIGAITILSAVAAAVDLGCGEHWEEIYRRLSEEKQGIRWTKHLSPKAAEELPPLTLYFNQFAVSLSVLERCEPDASRKAQLHALLRGMAVRMLDTNVFDERQWRRLDWAGADVETLMRFTGLSLEKPTTVADGLAAFRPEWLSGKTVEARAACKLCYGLPTVAVHTALLCGDADVVERVRPMVTRMVQTFLEQGEAYDGGENFNRTVIIGMLMVGR